jgi:RNA polymerase sigma-70 factor (ECF subfamily)
MRKGPVPAVAPEPSERCRTALSIETVDGELVERIRAGDELAFEMLFRRYSSALGDYATALVRRRAVAEELVHDVLLRVWQRRESWALRGNLRAYLFAATRNAVLTWLKHRHVEWEWEEYVVREQRALTLDRSANGWTAAEGVMSDEWQFTKNRDAALDRAVATLSKRCREVFTLRWQRGMSYLEIATVTGLSPRTVENHLARALCVLREQLAGWDD